MNVNKQQTWILGIFLIVLGLVLWLNLWWLVLPGILLAGGVLGYRQRRSVGRVNEAVQIGLWGVGLSLLFLLDFFFPGVLLLAGLSILARGREAQIDDRLQRFVGRARVRPSATRSIGVQQVPVTTHPQAPVTSPVAPPNDTPAVGETTRLEG